MDWGVLWTALGASNKMILCIDLSFRNKLCSKRLNGAISSSSTMSSTIFSTSSVSVRTEDVIPWWYQTSSIVIPSSALSMKIDWLYLWSNDLTLTFAKVFQNLGHQRMGNLEDETENIVESLLANDLDTVRPRNENSRFRILCRNFFTKNNIQCMLWVKRRQRAFPWIQARWKGTKLILETT